MRDDEIARGARDIVGRLRDGGYEAYIVGGAVRDMVMGVMPEDYDIATDASPEDVVRMFPRTHPVGVAFGVTLVIERGHGYEVARFRTEGIYRDGRRPESVAPAGVWEDVLRRDFTINALLYDPVDDRVIDLVGGRDDIAGKLIRAIGDPRDRFREDRLRMLRAVRFAARLGFGIEPETFDALKAEAVSVRDVSAERIGDELGRMFAGPHPERALDLLDASGLLGVVLPEVAAMHGVPQPPEFHPEGDVYVHTRAMLERFGGGTVTLAFGILLHDAGKPATLEFADRIRFNRHDAVGEEMARTVMRRLRFSTAEAERVAALVRHHLRFIHVREMRRSTLRRFMAMDGFDELLELYRLDCLASHGDLTGYRFVLDTMQRERSGDADLAIPRPLIGGETLIGLGYHPGPQFKVMLDRIVDAQIEGEIGTEAEAIRLVKREFPR